MAPYSLNTPLLYLATTVSVVTSVIHVLVPNAVPKLVLIWIGIGQTRCSAIAGVTAEALRANMGSKSAISLQRGPVDPKFQVEVVAPPTILRRKLG